MRLLCSRHEIVVCVGLVVAVSVSSAFGDDAPSESTNRPMLASHSMDEPPALPDVDQQQALPALPAPSSPDSSAGSNGVKMPVARLPYRRANTTETTVVRAIPEPQVTNQTRQALGFYGGNPARQTLNQFPRRTPIQAGPPVSMRQQIKPFHAVYRDPTVSPYLNLYREEDDTQSAPNYYAFVRPQLEQIEANRLQQGELQQLMRQMQNRRTVAPPQQGSAAAPGRRTPGASTPARYMDTAQFYGGWAR